MFKKIHSKWLKILIILLIVAVIAFAAVSLTWLIYYNTKVKPIMQCLEKYEFVSEYDKDSRLNYYSYENEDERIGFVLSVPEFMKFFSDIQSLTGHLSSIDPNTGEIKSLTDYAYFFRYIPNLFGKGEYSFRIDDYTGVKDSYENGIYESSGPIANYDIVVDKEMNFISGDKAMYDEHYDELKKVYDSVMEMFGKDAFK